MVTGYCVADVLSEPADFESDDGTAAFWITGHFDDGIAWVGRFSGQSPWEKHPADEFLYVVEGSVRVTLLIDEAPTDVELGPGSGFVVPGNIWHRQTANGTVIETGATPGVTEHSGLPDPRVTESSDA